jgi:hypothetical protein
VKKPKRFKVPIPARKSIYSVCGEYETGRTLKIIPIKKLQYFADKEPEWVDIPEQERDEHSHTRIERATLSKINGEFVSTLDWPKDEHVIVEVLRGDWQGDWPPQDWSPITRWDSLGEGRWLKALFAGKCADCSSVVEKDQRALWFKEKRVLVCEPCGKRAQKVK